MEQKYGIPTAPFTTEAFISVVEEDRKAGFVPFLYTPHPVIGMSDEALDGYVVGNNPDTGRPVIEDIIDNFTKPVDPAKLKFKGAVVDTDGDAYLKPDTEENLQQLFYERGWTDGLPIVLPTQERVDRMLAATCAAPEEIVGEMMRFDIRGTVQYTVKNVATIAVMAGAKPEYFPVILAVAASQLEAIQSSTSNWSAMLLVNGPIRNEIGMNSGIGALSPGNMANAVIGRAWSLMSTCWVDLRPGKNMWSSLGSSLNYNNNCCAENEEASVWEPFHVQKGFRKEESVVSIFRGWVFVNSAGSASQRSIGEEMCLQLSTIPPTNGTATVVMDPGIARMLKENYGFTKKEDFSQWLSENAKMPAERFWGYDHVDWMVKPLALQGIEPYASFLRAKPDELITPYFDPERINLVVVGGDTNPLWKISEYGYARSESVDKWRAEPSAADDCADGSCGIPDPYDPAEYE
ncbi:MAG: hypothetical protein GX357_06465 [Firmicutes bacterium]|nr:hypothetical protein [Bacillota bacterium]